MFEWYGLMTTTLESIKTNYINNKNSKLFNTPINNISLSNHHLNLLNQSTLHQFIAEIICYNPLKEAKTSHKISKII